MPQSSRPDRSSASVIARSVFCLCGAAVVLMIATMSADAEQQVESNPSDADVTAVESPSESAAKPKFESELIRGKVVWLAAALKSEFGISTVPEVAENSLALWTNDGQLLPIVENLRGRAFRKDERLREMEVEILARRYDDQPFIQVLKLFQIDGQKRFQVDYWCDVCAIVMFETGPCACCQDDNRLRKRPAPSGE